MADLKPSMQYKPNPTESLLNLDKILQDTRYDPMLSYKILKKFYEILLQTRSYENLQDPTVS